MIVRKFRPVQEEITGVWFQTAFIIFWYLTILINILRSGFRMDYLIFIVAGLLPVYMVIQCARSAYFYRRERREAIRLGNVRPGRIVNVVRKIETYEDSNRRRQYHHYYYLTVEIMNLDTGIANEFESQAYRLPVHRYLSSPYVQVYTDETGWKHYIEGFQFKENKHEPDIIAGTREFEDTSVFPRVVQTVVLLMIILSIVKQYFR